MRFAPRVSRVTRLTPDASPATQLAGRSSDASRGRLQWWFEPEARRGSSTLASLLSSEPYTTYGLV